MNKADTAETPEFFQDAGYVLTDDDLVVDIDSVPKETIEKMLTIFQIKTQTVWTERGVHLYFQKRDGFKGANRVCGLGFPIEFKHSSNTKSVTVKRNGVLRKTDNPGVRQELPDIFAVNKRLDNLMGLEEGEGRNNKLFNHRVKTAGMTGWETALKFINSYIFTEPLPEEELEVIVRDMKIQAGKDDEPEIAASLIKKYKVIFYNSTLYFFNHGVYDSDTDRLRRMVISEVGSKKIRYIDEVIRQMEYRSPVIPSTKVFDIKFNNGVLRQGEFIPVESEEFTPYNIEIEYNPEAEPVEIVDEYIKNLTSGNENYRKLLFEILAHTLIVDPEFKRLLAKFFIFVGDGGNGKGTLLTIIRKILNNKNITGLSIKNMTDERYFVTMRGKLANLGDDIQDSPINDEQMKILKNISSCDLVSTRELFKQSIEAELTISLIFTSNHILKTFEKGESYKRRVVWLPMYTKPKKKDPLFITKLTTPEALEYWMRLVIEGYFRLYENSTFTECDLVEQFNKEYHEENNASLLYLEGMGVEDFEGKRNTEVYQDYEAWCDENDVKPSRKLLRDALEEKMGLVIRPVTRNRKTERRFMIREIEGQRLTS